MVDFEVLSVSDVTRRDKSIGKGIELIGALYQKLLRFYCLICSGPCFYAKSRTTSTMLPPGV